jgi:hypothetical protein
MQDKRLTGPPRRSAKQKIKYQLLKVYINLLTEDLCLPQYTSVYRLNSLAYYCRHSGYFPHGVVGSPPLQYVPVEGNVRTVRLDGPAAETI